MSYYAAIVNNGHAYPFDPFDEDDVADARRKLAEWRVFRAVVELHGPSGVQLTEAWLEALHDDISGSDETSCRSCAGTGIGKHGDPAISMCLTCNGRRSWEDDDDHEYVTWEDR